MERQMIFHILQIQETKEEGAIKAAYMKLLKSTNPEDDPEGFKRLREAYEGALAFSRQSDEQDQKEKTEIDIWIDRVDEICGNILLRRDPEEWKGVLSDPLCDDLDTSLECRERFLAYLMDHANLPQSVWKLIDDTFLIREDRENLEQKFPVDFLNYIIHYMENREFIDYDLFLVTDRKAMDVDGYIQNYFSVKRRIDQESFDGCEEKIDGLRAFGLYHPYEDAERLRLLTAGQKKEEAAALGCRLLSEYGENSYVAVSCADAFWMAGDRDRANELWEEILKTNPGHYTAKVGRIRWLMEKEQYGDAKELMMDILNADPGDDAVNEYLKKANDALIQKYEETLAGVYEKEEDKNSDRVELGWCLFQNAREEEAIRLLESFAPDSGSEYSYTNLYGRVLYKAEKYEQALPMLEKWLEMILAAPDDGSEESRKRRRREFQARYLISGCLQGMGDTEQALIRVGQAVDAARDEADWFSSSQYRAQLLFEQEKYELCVDACDRILEKDDRYYPAYVQRQEAAFELRRGQQVVDDFYHAIGIYSGYYKPYLLAAQVFFYYDQFEDAKGVIDRARENQVDFSPNLKLFEAKILRNLALSPEDRKKIFPILEELLEQPEDEETDIEDHSELEFETALLHWDDNRYSDALAHLGKAMDENPERMQYHLICGHIRLEMKEYKAALSEYSIATEEYEDSPSLHYNRGICHEELGMKLLAKEDFEKTLECQEGYRDACEKLAGYYKAEYRTRCARADFEKSLDYFNRQLAVTENCYYLVERGRLYMEAYDFEPAIRDFKKALEYVETDWASYNNIGCCYKYMGQYETAVRYFQKSISCLDEENRSVLPYSNMADCYEALGDYRKAIWCYEKDMEMFPEWQSFHVEIGKLYTYLGEYEKALQSFLLVPDDSGYYEHVSDVYFLQGKRRESIKTLQNGIKKAKTAGDKADAYEVMARFYMDYEREYKKAEAMFKKALQLETRNGELHELEWETAELYFRMGRRKDAAAHAKKALEYFKKTQWRTEEDYLNFGEYRPARLMRHGWIYICLGETEKGLQMFEAMTGCTRCRQCRHEECYESFLYLGMYYEAVGDLKKALDYYKKGLAANGHSIALMAGVKALEKRTK